LPTIHPEPSHPLHQLLPYGTPLTTRLLINSRFVSEWRAELEFLDKRAYPKAREALGKRNDASTPQSPFLVLVSEMRNARPKVFYGWWVALTAALGLFLNTATIIVFSFGFFARAIGQEFHVGRAKVSLAFTIHNLTSALCIPLAGRLVDRYGPRRVLLPFTALLGLILVCSLFLSVEIWQLYVFYLALGVVSGGAGAMPYTDVVSHWFDRHRGLAISVMMLGMGLGAIAIPSVAQRLVATLGWRLAYTVFGFSIVLIPLPVVAAFLKERPENMGLLPDGDRETQIATRVAANDIGLTVREAVRTSEFWTIVSVLFLVTASVHACFIHLPAILTDRGSSTQLAAFASSLFGVGLFMGRVGCGYLLDQFFAPRVAALLFAAVAIGIVFLGLGHSIWSACIAAVLVGLGIGAEVDIIAYLTSRYFGLRSYGAIFGWIWAVFGVSGGLGAYLMGFGFDKTGSYVVPLLGFFCAAVLATLLIVRLGPYRYRVART
jgi:MFS family permease